jgi:hypothetical protein
MAVDEKLRPLSLDRVTPVTASVLWQADTSFTVGDYAEG